MDIKERAIHLWQSDIKTVCGKFNFQEWPILSSPTLEGATCKLCLKWQDRALVNLEKLPLRG